MKARTITGVVLVVLALATPAVAQTPGGDAQRRELIAQAIQASEQGDHPHALDLAERAGRIRMSTALRMLLAQEHNSLGHLLDAYDFSTRCVREAESDPALVDRTRILDGCNAVVSSVREHIGRVALRMPDPAPPGLRVRVQGSEVAAANLGLPCPVLPGTVVIDVTAQGGSFRRELVVDAGQTREVVVELTPNAATSGSHPVAPIPTSPTASSGPGAGPWIVAGVGAAMFGAAAAFYVLRNNAHDEALRDCDTTWCYNGDAQDRAQTWNTLTNVALATGGAAVAGAAVWFIVARVRATTPARTAWNWGLAPTAGGLAAGVGGSF